MNFILRLFGDAFQAWIRDLAQEGMRKAALVIAATIILAGGFIMVMVAAYLALAPIASPPIAALVVALGFAIVGGFLLWLARPDSASRRREPANPTANPYDVTTLEKQFSALVKENPKSAALWALIAGVAVGASPELRRALLALLTPKDDKPSGRDG